MIPYKLLYNKNSVSDGLQKCRCHNGVTEPNYPAVIGPVFFPKTFNIEKSQALNPAVLFFAFFAWVIYL